MRILTMGHITAYDRKPMVKKLKSEGIDGINRRAVSPEGWQLTWSADRENNNGEAFWADYEAAYYAGQTVTNVSALETIREADGSVSQYRYVGLAFHLDDAGNAKADSFIQQKYSGEAAQRIRVT